MKGDVIRQPFGCTKKTRFRCGYSMEFYGFRWDYRKHKKKSQQRRIQVVPKSWVKPLLDSMISGFGFPIFVDGSEFASTLFNRNHMVLGHWKPF